jgi:ATP-dependent Clp protease protease subunit
MKVPKFAPPRNCEECETHNQDRQNLLNLKDQIWHTHLQNRQIVINEDISDMLIEKAVLQVFMINEYDDSQELQFKEYTRYPITIFINTSGGVLDETFSLISAIKASKTPIHTVGLGKIWSAGFLILIAGHQRYCQEFSSLMLHQLSAGIFGEYKRMHEYTEYYKKCHDISLNFVLKNTKIPKKRLEEIFDHKQDWFITSEEALKYGIIDGII